MSNHDPQGLMGDRLCWGFTSRGGPEPGDLGGVHQLCDWEGLARAAGMPGAPVARLRQVHGAGVVWAREGGDLGEGDALLTDVAGLLLAVRVADCVPVLAQGRGGVAAIHAGWRGLVAGVIPAAIQALGGAVQAVVGPCIGVAAYEVGEELVAAVLAAGAPEALVVQRDLGPRPHLDLRAFAAWQLGASGVGRIAVDPRCTFSDPLLHSHRRDGPAAGRMVGWVGVRP